MKNLNLSGQTRWLRGVALAISNAKMRVNPRMTPTSTACDLGFTLSRMCAVFCILFTIGVGNVRADYTIIFKDGSGTSAIDASTLSNFINSGTSYVTSASSSRMYPSGGDGTGYGIRLASGSYAGDLTLNLSATGQIKASKITFNAASYGSDGSTMPYTITYTDNTTTTGTISTLSTSLANKEVSLTSTKTIKTIYIGTTAKKKRVYVHSITVTAAAFCSADPTIGTASLNGSFSLSSVGVQCASITPGENCSVASGDYGFIWYAGTGNKEIGNDGVTKVAVTSGAYSSGSFSKNLAGPFSVGNTYTFRAFATNGKPATAYSDAVSFTPRSVTFNLNGHGSSAPSTQYVNDGGKATDPSYTETVEGWSFGGWYKEAGCTNAWDFSTDVVSGSNKELFAKWTVQTYTITKTLTNVTNSSLPASFTYTGSTTTALNSTFSVDEDNYILPSSITVTMGGSTLTRGTHYSYDSSTGAFTFNVKITGDIVITATATAKLKSIAITTQPTKRAYLEGQTFSSTGAVVKATMGNGTTKNVSATWTPASALSAGTGQTVTASYTENGITKTATTTVDVYAVTLQAKAKKGAGDTPEAIAGGSPGAPTLTVASGAISPATDANNYVFWQWEVSGASLGSSATTKSNTLTNPTGAVILTAIYHKPITITWLKGNAPYDTGSPTTSIGYNKQWKDLTPPTAPGDATLGACANKFMGWSNSMATDWVAEDHHTAPATLLKNANFSGNTTVITGDITFRAVYATASGGGSGSFEISTSDFGSSYSSTESTLTKLSTNDIGYKQIRKNQTNSTPSGWCANACTEIRGGNNGHGELYNKSAISGLNKLRVYEVSGASNLTVYYGTSSKANSSSVSSPFASETGTESVSYNKYASSTCTESNISLNYYDVTIPSGNDYFYIYASSAATIYKIIVYYATTSYSDYVTNCCSLAAVTDFAVSSATGTSVTLGWTAPSPTIGITKLQVVEGDGTVMVDNLEASATGATISGLTECDEYTFAVRSVGASCYTESDPIDAQPYSGAKTVTYNYHEGTGSPASFTTACGSLSATLPTPTRENYRFEGWYTEASGGTRKGGGGDSYTPDATITLHAQWTRVYTVSYAYAGGSGSCAGGSYAEGETVTTCATATKAGSTLTGWTRSDNSATVTPGNTFTMPASNVTLTAVWEDTPYTLTQNVGSHTTKGYSTATIKSGDLTSGGLDMTYTISDNSYALPKAVTISGGGQTWTLGTNYTWTLSADKHSATLHIETDLTISEDVTVTVSEQARYTVIWDDHGSTTTEYYATDDNTVTLKTGIADCGEKKFYGWTEDADFTTHATIPPTMASSGTISADKHYYAIYADAAVPANPGYNKVTTISSGTYIIASASKAYGGGDAAVDASPSDGVIASLPSGAKELTVTLGTGDDTGYFAISYDNSGTTTYIYGGDKSLSTTTTANYNWSLGTGTYAGEIISKYTKESNIYYLQQNGSVYRCYAHTQTAAYMYKKQTTTYSNFAKTCTLYDIDIADTDDGIVTTTPSAGTGAAGEGQTVTVNVTPNSCKYLSALKYNDGSDHAISIASTPYTFTMPASDVTVTATFEDKSVTSIAVNTSSHRTLMESTAFVGEQIRVTYNNGETEDLAWDDASQTFSGYNMSALGNQTVSVAYVGSCGSANTSYSIEVVDGVPVTYHDGNTSYVRKYELDEMVGVDTITGKIGCSGYTFVGWSETEISSTDDEYVPVHNFAATTKTLYAVYALQKQTGWMSIHDEASAKSGARYAIVAVYSSDKIYELTPTVKNTNYLDGTDITSYISTYRFPETYYDYYIRSSAPPAANQWEFIKYGNKFYVYNNNQSKYLQTTLDGYLKVSTAVLDSFTVNDGGSDCAKTVTSAITSKNVRWYNSDKNWTSYSSGTVLLLTKDSLFTTNPPCSPRSVTFHGNGGVVSDGVNEAGDLVVTETSRDAGITTPVATYEDCSGKTWTFAGWLDREAPVSRVPIQTTDLLNDGGGNKSHTITADNEEYWAVYSNQGEAQTKYGDVAFSMSDIGLAYSSSETTVTKTVAGMGDYVFGYTKLGHQSNIGIQFENGTGEFYNKTALGKINSISFTSFSTGGVNNLKVYVGDTEKATTHQLTAAELQVVGSTYTYYPTSDCEYVYIKDYNSYVCVDGISVEFGKGTVVYSTTPDCKRITLSGEIYATSRNGIGIMTATPLRVNTYNLDANANVVITSNSSDVYFTTAKNANFAMAAANQPKNSVTVTAGVDGNLSTDVYIHYKPSSTGDGNPATVTVSAAPATPDPSVSTATHDIHVRNLSDKIVIAAKVGGAYYALPADMSGATNPAGVLIDVDETTMTATAPENCTYTIWPVKTVNPNVSTYDRYTANATYSGNAYGDRVRFSAVNNTTANAGLWANNAASGTTINNSAAIAAISDGGTTTNTNPSYEWKITTTVSDGKWSHTLQTDQTTNKNYLRYWTAATGGPKWGTYASGENNLYLLPVTEVGDATITAMEWGTDAMVVSYPNGGNCTEMKAKIGSNSPTDVTMTLLGGDIYKLTDVGTLQDNPAKALTLRVTESGDLKQAVLTVPLIVTAEKTEANLRSYAGGGTGADKLTEGGEIAKQTDVVIRDGGVLTTGTASGVFKDLYIYPGGKAKITNNFKAANIYMRGGYSFLDNKETYKYPDLYVSGATITTSGVKYDLYMDNRLYYMFSMPYDVTLASVTDETGSEDFDVWVKHYNGATRATGTKVTGWEWYGDDAETQHSFFAGVGYEITAKPRVSGRPLAILRFPVQSGNVTSDASNSPSITVTNHGKAAYDAGTLQANNVGWNFIGNPYKTAYKATSDTSMIVDKGFVQHMVNGVWDGTYDWTGASGVRYITVPYDTENDYHHERVADYEIPAFSTFFIQTTSSGTFHMGGAQVAASIAPRFGKAPQTPKETSVDITLSGEGEKVTGKAGLVISEVYAGGLQDFEDVEQWFVENNQLKTYMLIDGTALAYNLTNEQAVEQAIPMGYIATIAGEHTYSINETNDVSRLAHLWLTDHDAGITTDLLVRDYTFITDVGRFDERFCITAVMEQEDIYTDISSPHDTDWAANIGVYSDGKTLTLRGLPEDSKVYVYDMIGKLMASGEQQNSMVALEVAAQGVYNIRVVNGSNAVTLRSVIR